MNMRDLSMKVVNLYTSMGQKLLLDKPEFGIDGKGTLYTVQNHSKPLVYVFEGEQRGVRGSISRLNDKPGESWLLDLYNSENEIGASVTMSSIDSDLEEDAIPLRGPVNFMKILNDTPIEFNSTPGYKLRDGLKKARIMQLKGQKPIYPIRVSSFGGDNVPLRYTSLIQGNGVVRFQIFSKKDGSKTNLEVHPSASTIPYGVEMHGEQELFQLVKA